MTTEPLVTKRHQPVIPADPDPPVAACATVPVGLLTATFFPPKGDAGLEAARICARCELREPCLRAAVERNEPAGVWGGAGEPRRKVLRRNLRRGPEAFGAALAAHFRALDGCEDAADRLILQSFGAGATHGRRVTYAKGCRCEPCTLAAACNTARTSRAAAPEPVDIEGEAA